MTTETITSTRENLIKDTHNLKQDAGQIVDDVKKHASAHVDAVKEKVNDTFDVARACVKDHPLKVTAAALFIGFLFGTFRRR
jgi:ElaB/YqjD/DUF883 family membrane-anchored ribosome-binding protein